MFVREYGLVHNPDYSERFVRLVKWERRWLPCMDEEGEECESASLVPVAWEWTLLDVGNPRSFVYEGPSWSMTPTAIVELSMDQWRSVWPREQLPENEELRRLRIRTLRRACHVDQDKGLAEPQWQDEPARAVA